MELQNIKVEHITDNGNGTADMQVTLDEKSTKLLIRKGMKQVMAIMGEKVDTMPVVDQFSKRVKEYCLTDSEAQLLIQVGVLSSLKTGVNEHVDDPVPCNTSAEIRVTEEDPTSRDLVDYG